jgi:hypothetical protein
LHNSGLFDEPSGGSAAKEGTRSFEQRIDEFAAAAKDATSVAVKVRTALNSLTENARAGSVSAAAAQLARLSETLAGLSNAVDQLAGQSSGLRGQHANTADFARELQAALATKGVDVMKGPQPYWLTYPAWYKIEQNSKGAIEVILNGDKVDAIRPSTVAATIAELVDEKFNAKQFVDLLRSVRDLLRRTGAPGRSLRLEDVYEVLALEPGKRAIRRKDFTKGAFYYSVHRLAEEMGRASGPELNFPPSDKSDQVFFTEDGESVRYVTVEFNSVGLG